jgi:hypothetical protein
MKRRSKVSGRIKGRRRKTPKPKRRNARKTVARSKTCGGDESEVAQLTRELNEALERQSATSEVLNVISGSPGELDPVFNAILQNAARICQAQFGTLNLYDGIAYRTVARHNAPHDFARTRLGKTFRPHPKSGLAHVARKKQIVRIDNGRFADALKLPAGRSAKAPDHFVWLQPYRPKEDAQRDNNQGETSAKRYSRY